MSHELETLPPHPPKSGLTGMDVLGLIACWGGAVGVAYALKDPVVSVVALAGAYYLAKGIILK